MTTLKVICVTALEDENGISFVYKCFMSLTDYWFGPVSLAFRSGGSLNSVISGKVVHVRD